MQGELNFYSSTSQTNEERLKEKVRAGSQALRVWNLMKDGKKRTSVEVSEALQMNLNSARRCLTDLMKKFNLLNKLDELKAEKFGGNNHYYQKL